MNDDSVAATAAAHVTDQHSSHTTLTLQHAAQHNAHTQVRTLTGHTARIGCMDWAGHVLATGSRDRSVLLRDSRSPEHFVSKLAGHKQEVCGLKWSLDGQQVCISNCKSLPKWRVCLRLPRLDCTAAHYHIGSTTVLFTSYRVLCVLFAHMYALSRWFSASIDSQQMRVLLVAVSRMSAA
jgi:WD40 repeat protein